MAPEQEQNYCPEMDPKEVEVCELPEKEFKITIKMPYKLQKMMHKQNENLNKEIENTKKEPKKNFGAKEYNN